MPTPTDKDSPQYHACVRAKRLAKQELRMFEKHEEHKDKRRTQSKQYRAHKLTQQEKDRQVEGYMARARQNRIQASRERNEAIKHQVLAEELAHKAEMDRKRHEGAIEHAKRDSERYLAKTEDAFSMPLRMSCPEFETYLATRIVECLSEYSIRAASSRYRQKLRGVFDEMDTGNFKDAEEEALKTEHKKQVNLPSISKLNTHQHVWFSVFSLTFDSDRREMSWPNDMRSVATSSPRCCRPSCLHGSQKHQPLEIKNTPPAGTSRPGIRRSRRRGDAA